MAKLIIGVAGEMSSGKGSVAKHIVQNYNAGSHKFSTILRNVLDRVYIEQSRENISALSLALRKAFGQDIFSKSMFNDVQNDAHDIVVIDGIRRIEDVEHLKLQKEFKFIYIEADIATCYYRSVARGENPGDREKTFEEFQNDHEKDADASIRDLKNYADHVIENNGTFAELYAKIDEIIKSYQQ